MCKAWEEERDHNAQLKCKTEQHRHALVRGRVQKSLYEGKEEAKEVVNNYILGQLLASLVLLLV